MQNNHYFQVDKNLAIADNVYQTPIKGLFYLRYQKYLDKRGFFSQVLQPQVVRQHINPNFTIKQVNLSVSKTKVIRGIHAENWNKLITVLSGHAHLVIVDLKQQSATYKHVVHFDFSADLDKTWGESLYISAKLGNSICAIQGPVYYLYGVDHLYQDRTTSDDQAISVFDTELNISWPFTKEEIIISQRDLNALSLKELKIKE